MSVTSKVISNVTRRVTSSVAVSSGGGGDVPANALTFNGQVLTYNGETLTYTESE